MDKKLKRSLLKTALISSPLLALYAIVPVFIFSKIPTHLLFLASIGLTGKGFIFWLLNIFAIQASQQGNIKWKRYSLSYGFTFLLHLLSVLFEKDINSLGISGNTFIAYAFVFVFATNTIIIVMSNSVLVSLKKETAELEVEQLKVTNLEAQKQVLMQQLQPHFLFNTLSVLKSLIRENQEEAENYTVKLSEFMRYSIEVHKSDLVTLQQELKFTNDYLELQKVCYENSLMCSITIPKSVYKKKIPAYALQTLVENAIKHNSFTEKQPLLITINYFEGLIKVTNNKNLFTTAEISGTGLNNLNERYKIIANQEIEINDDIDEFCVTIKTLNS
jgi:two-component system, LytTR family, sensor kinase